MSVPGGVTPVTDPLPINSSSEVGNPPRFDIESTLREMHLTMQSIQEQNGTNSISPDESVEGAEFITSVAKEVSRKNMWGKILMYFAGIIGTAFSVGMAYQLFIGANATDDEVEEVVHNAVVEHNGGKDPEVTSVEGAPIGHHPEMKESIQQLEYDTKQIKADVGVIVTSQKKAEKRSEYQYEFSRWQAGVMECNRTRRCKAPKKPARLKVLESDIYLGKF